MNRKQQDAQILGTPLGTAKTKLNRSLILHFANLCNQQLDCCSICGKKIVEADHLAVTHKEPWRMHGPDAFYDLQNVTLRHTWCSAPQHAPRRQNNMSIVQVTVINKSNSPLPTFAQGEDLHVAGQPGEKYDLKFYNKTCEKVCVVVSVDGIDVLTEEIAKPQAGGHIINGFDTIIIEGFRKSTSGTTQFSFSSSEGSYAAQTDRPENTGVIGVSVFKEEVTKFTRRWRSSQERTSGILRSCGAVSKGVRMGTHGATMDSMSIADTGSTLGTEFSGHVESHIQQVDFIRESDTPNEVTVLYYDTEESLRARGIIQAVKTKPNPFPAAEVYEAGFCKPPTS